jgi:hypothetical protein
MKIENINSSTLHLLQNRHQQVNNAIKDISEILAQPIHESDGGNTKDGLRSVYSLYLAEYRDASGDCIDLTGLQVYIETLNFLLGALKRKKTEIEQAINEL